MTMNQSIPEVFIEDEALSGRLCVRLTDALNSSAYLSESDWKKFAVLHSLQDQITNHHRFLRSLNWGDADFEGYVLDLLQYIIHNRPSAFIELMGYPNVRKWFEKNEKDLLSYWDGTSDPLITAIAHGLEQVESTKNVIDVSVYTRRIQAALPNDTNQALGATKELLEATMRSILSDRGADSVEKLDFQKLVADCFTMLNLSSNSEPSSPSERHLRKMINSARNMIAAANELRNLAGTGHGRVVGDEIEVSIEDASLVAASGLILSAWLLRKSDLGN